MTVLRVIDYQFGGEFGFDPELPAASFTETESAAPRDQTVTITVAGNAPFFFGTVLPITFGGAIRGTDFVRVDAEGNTLTSSALEPVAGQSTVELRIKILTGAGAELAITLAQQSGGEMLNLATIGANPTYTLTFEPDPEIVPVAISWQTATANANEADQSYTATLVATPPPLAPLTVSLGVNGSNSPTLSSSLVTIDIGQSAQTVQINWIDDVLPESREEVAVRMLSVTSPGTLPGGLGNVFTLEIQDDDTPDNGRDIPTVNFAVQEEQVAEEVGTHSVLVNLSNTYTADTSVSFAVSGTADPATDYTVLTASPLVIPSGSTQGQILVQVLDDTAREASENVVLSIGDLINGEPGDTLNYRLTIADTDSGGAGDPPIASFALEASSVVENAGPIDITVNLDAPAPAEVSIEFSTMGTASAPDDYTATGSPLVIPTGQSQGVITVTPIDDTDDDPTRTLIFTLDSATGATLGQNTHTLSINDDDGNPDIPADDGDNEGQVSVRQSLPAADLKLTPSGITVMSDVAVTQWGTTGTFHPWSGNPGWAFQVLRMAEDFWINKNQGNIDFLRSQAGRLAQGQLVRIDIEGDIWSARDSFMRVGANSASTLGWIGNVLRDVAFVGTSGPGTDIVGAIQYDGIGDAWVANIRYQNLTLRNGAFNSAPILVSKQSGETAPFCGAIRVYDSTFEGHPTGTFGGTGMKWGCKGSGRAAWDLRNCYFNPAEEHSAYVDSPQGFFVAIDCEIAPGGNGRTMFQVVNRYSAPGDTNPSNNPGPSGFGVIYWARNIARDNSLTIPSGGSDFTVVGFDGEVYMTDNQSIGGSSQIASSARGSIAVWCDGNGPHGVYPLFDNQGNQYTTRFLQIRGHTIDLPDAPRGHVKITGCNTVRIESINFVRTTPGWPQITFNEYAVSGNDGYQNTPGNVEWGPAMGSSPSQDSGWSDDGPKVLHGNYIDYSTMTQLSDTQIDAYDGTNPL